MAATTKLFLIVVCLLNIQVSCAVRIYGNYTGDILLAAFFPVHRRIGADDDVQVGSSSSVCGEIQEEDGVQAMEAFYYALDKINHDPTLLRGYTLGAVVLDSCDDDTHALEQAVELIRVLMTRDEISDLPYRCPGGTLPVLDPGAAEFYKVVGVIGGSTSSVSLQLASLLKLFYLPQVSYLSTSPDLSNIERFPFFKRTVPSDSYQAKAIVELLREFEWTYVSMIYEDSNYGIKGYGELERAATENGICFAYLKRIDFDEPDWGPADYEGIIKGMTEKDRSKVAVLWADFPRARELFEAAHRLNKTDIIWVGSDGWSGRTLAVEDLGHVVKNAIAVQPLARKLGGFDNHFTSLNYTNIRNPWLREYWEHHFECKWPKSKLSKDHSSDNGKTEDKHHKDVSYNVDGVRECTGKEIIGSENGFKQQLSLHFVSDAAFTFAHALAAMHNHTCGGQDGLCEGMKPSNISGPDLLAYLGQVNFSSASGEHFEFINGVDGPPRYTIMSFENNQRHNGSLWVEVGTYMAKSNVIDGELSLHPDFRAKMGRSPPSSCSVPCGPQQARTYVKGDRCCWVCTNCTVWSIVLIYGDEEICVPCPNGMQPNSNFTSCENMVPSFMSHSSPWGIASMCVALVFTIYAVFTTVVFGLYYSTPVVKASGRELSFILLAVIITSYLSTFVFIAKPSPATCSLTRILLGLCYAGIYASILAKASRISRIFNDGAGSPKRARLTSPRSQLLIVGLLLIVEVLVLAVWFAASPPSTKYVFPDRGTRLLVCKGSDDASYLIALIYPFLLMLTCLVYAFKTRKTPDGFNETRLITFTSYTTVVIWLAFITLFFINQYNNEVRITTLWVSLTLNATVALSCLLVPKVYICLFRPEKNTREAVMTRSQSVLSSSSLPNATPDQQGRGQESPDANRRNSRRSSSLANQTWQTGIVNGGVVGISPGSSVDKGSPMKARMRTNSATQTTFDLTFYAPVYEVSEDESSKTKPETPQQEKTTKKTYIWDPEAGYADIDDVTLEFPGSDVPGRGVPTKAQFRRVSIAKLKELPGIDESSSTT